MEKDKKNVNDAPEFDAPEPLSKEELEMIKASMKSRDVDRSTLAEIDQSDVGKARRFAKKNKAFIIACAVLAVFVIALVTVLTVAAIQRMDDIRVNRNDYTIIIGDEKYTVKYKSAVRDGILYVDMYKISDYAELTRSGSVNNVKFTASPLQYLRFEDQSEYAVINGAMVEMPGKATVNKDVCEIPFEFLKAVLGKNNNNGLRLSLDKETNTIKISRRMYEPDDRDVIMPVEISFYSDTFDVIQAIQRPSPEDSKYEYSIDVSAYLNSIAPENAEEYLILANKTSPLGEDYAPADLIKLECRTNKPIYLRKDAANALYAIMLEMTASGITDVFVTSAYRSYSYQVGLFEGYVKTHMEAGMTREEAEAAALEYSAKAGTSEHQTGLCLDFMTYSMNDLDESFENTAAFRWLSKNAHKYGFILRYEKDKVDTTGYKYEPWHYRFVGRAAATEIYNSGLCLEEYLALN